MVRLVHIRPGTALAGLTVTGWLTALVLASGKPAWWVAVLIVGYVGLVVVTAD